MIAFLPSSGFLSLLPTPPPHTCQYLFLIGGILLAKIVHERGKFPARNPGSFYRNHFSRDQFLTLNTASALNAFLKALAIGGENPFYTFSLKWRLVLLRIFATLASKTVEASLPQSQISRPGLVKKCCQARLAV